MAVGVLAAIGDEAAERIQARDGRRELERALAGTGTPGLADAAGELVRAGITIGAEAARLRAEIV